MSRSHLNNIQINENQDSRHYKSLSSLLFETIVGVGVSVATVYAIKIIYKIANEKYSVSSEIARKLRRPELAKMVLNDYEAKIGSSCLVAADDLVTTFNDIGGMKDELVEVIDNVVLPVQIWKSLKGQSDIIPCPTGVLLYGKPGTGKTLTAKALAKECGATFLEMNSSVLLDKYLGESDKLASGVFSLARKLAPTIIFIDEIESILRTRSTNEFGSSATMGTIQSVLLAEWDGLKTATASEGPVIVVGATNRPNDIDSAFLRRLPVFIETKTPTKEDREDILRKMLTKESIDSDLNISYVAEMTNDFTGSELRELVRVASVNRVKRVIKQIKDTNSNNTGKDSVMKYDQFTVSNVASCQSPLSMADFDFALTKTEKSENIARDYGAQSIAKEIKQKMDSIKEELGKF